MQEKRFKFKHMLGSEEYYSESGMPKWLTHREYAWFLRDHVLTLEVGQTVETDFHEITRIE